MSDDDDDDDMSDENKTPDKKDDEISNDWDADERLMKIHTNEKKVSKENSEEFNSVKIKNQSPNNI